VEKVEAQARAAGYRARVVLASEPFTARALARFGAETRACVGPGGSERALAALPLQALEDAPEVVASLRALGLSTLGELSALQSTQVISRLGAQGLRAQRLVRGQDESRLLPRCCPRWSRRCARSRHRPSRSSRCSSPSRPRWTASRLDSAAGSARRCG
jgi:hypothetical protein